MILRLTFGLVPKDTSRVSSASSVDGRYKVALRDVAPRDLYKRLKKERGTNKAELKREKPTEKIEEAIAKLDEKIKTFKLQMEDREAGKEVALGTRYVQLHLDGMSGIGRC